MGSSERPVGAEPRRRTPLMASFAGLIFLAGSLLLAFVPPHRLRLRDFLFKLFGLEDTTALRLDGLSTGSA